MQSTLLMYHPKVFQYEQLLLNLIHSGQYFIYQSNGKLLICFQSILILNEVNYKYEFSKIILLQWKFEVIPFKYFLKLPMLNNFTKNLIKEVYILILFDI